MVKAVVAGAGGKMGGRIISLIPASDGIQVSGAFEKEGHPLIGRDVGETLGLGRSGVSIRGSLEECIQEGDVVIDFTHHESSLKHLEIAVKHKAPIVIGTTGFTADEVKKIRELAPKTRCVLAPNMSVGVNVMFKVLDYVSGILKDDFDVEIVEAHHNLKKDAPSGTAMRMAQIIAGALGRNLDKTAVYERKGMVGARTKEEIGIQTIRAGDITGEHWVIFGGIGERLEFIHRAHNRDNFAKGAIRAAKWIVNQKPGFYDMQDVLGLRDK
ncbi:MAG TPA: 4-hydroxy-tetrahydrodipicolinate reductase [Syntrophales bacterium]|jgi:4-hydroxy-tetrahydrodipicolinate reductase|nr:4-hydroxy-tetrahydrodipicolinate reductase [Syntrophales bacterium]HRT62041.1 4-hydroxy-tetrahydrodipicolinate reductase [Syntrophales bacterium]